MTRRRGRRCKKLLDDPKDRRVYSHLKEEALDRTVPSTGSRVVARRRAEGRTE